MVDRWQLPRRVPAQVTGPLRQEATEFTRIAVASIKTARGGPREG